MPIKTGRTKSHRRLKRPLSLNHQRIIKAAVKMIDEDGLSFLSMRRLAERLGVKAMSLYRYFSSKSKLLDAIQEELFSKLPALDDRSEWQELLRQMAKNFRACLKKHPHAVELFGTRPLTSERYLCYVERIIDQLSQQGFTPKEALFAFQALAIFTIGHALAEVAPPAGEEDSNWEPEFGSVNPSIYPTITRAFADPEATDFNIGFHFAVEAFIMGLEKVQVSSVL